MKKISILIVCISLSFSSFSNSTIKNFRAYYYDVCLNKKSIADFEEYIEIHKGSSDIVIKGYQSALWFLKADYYLNPIQKWKFFKKGKEQLEKLINSNYQNTELRFLRLTIQDHTPDFIGYNKNKNEDRKFIYKQLNKISDKDLYEKIVNYLCYNSITKNKVYEK